MLYITRQLTEREIHHEYSFMNVGNEARRRWRDDKVIVGDLSPGLNAPAGATETRLKAKKTQKDQPISRPVDLQIASGQLINGFYAR